MSYPDVQERKCRALFTRSKRWNQHIFNLLISADPDGGSNCHWIIRQYKYGEIDLDHIDEIRDTISKYLFNKRVLPKIYRNIELLSYSDVKEIASMFTNTILTDISPDDPDIRLMYHGGYGMLASPRTLTGSMILGSGTLWCTSESDGIHYYKYTMKGTLYIWRDYMRNKMKYQFHFATHQFTDSKNYDIDDSLLLYYRMEHPILKQLFQREYI